MSKRMTLVIGAFCNDGMVFCSDTEEGTTGGGKRNVRKLFTYSGDLWNLLVGTAGFGPLCDVGAKRIIKAAASPDFIQNHEEKLGEVMAELYRQYIPQSLPEWKQQDRQVSFVIGIANRQSRERLLYQTHEEIVQPMQHRFACAGAGQEIAFYLLDRLFDEIPAQQSKQLLAFVMREAKQSVGGVGGYTETITVMTTSPGTVRSNFAHGWDTKQPRLSDNINKFWEQENILTGLYPEKQPKKVTRSTSQKSEPEQ